MRGRILFFCLGAWTLLIVAHAAYVGSGWTDSPEANGVTLARMALGGERSSTGSSEKGRLPDKSFVNSYASLRARHGEWAERGLLDPAANLCPFGSDTVCCFQDVMA